jgi:hypothetical protein
MTPKPFGHACAARGKPNVERAGGGGTVCAAGLRQGRVELTFHAIANRRRPIGIADGCTSAALNDAHERHHLLNDAELVIDKHRGRRLLFNQLLRVQYDCRMKLSKGQLGVTIVQGHHLRLGLCPKREWCMHQGVSHQSASLAVHGPRCEPRWRKAHT